jgi:Flp pilus assembly protein TadD
MWRHSTSTALVASMLILAGCGSVSVQHSAVWNKPVPALATVPAAAAVGADTGVEFQQAIGHMQAGNWDAAIAQLETLTATHGQFAGPWLNLGIAYTRSGAVDKARNAFETAAARNPRQAEAWNQLGMLHRRGGSLQQAATMYLRAIEVAPDHADSHWNLAVLYDQYLPNYATALHHLQRYQQLTGAGDPQVSRWLAELQSHTAPNMTAGANGQ